MANTLSPPAQEGTSLASLNASSDTSASPHPSLPQLPYSLRDHKKNIAIIWFLLFLDATVMPLTLYYPLQYASNLEPRYIFAVTTGVFGVISGLEWAYRSWQLWKKEEVRPFGGKREWFDCFHISYTIGYTICLFELIVGAAPHRPWVRVCAMPAPSFILFFGAELLLFSLFAFFNIPAPFKISSQPKGAPVRPGTYMLLEDVIAVDTGVGRTYRKALGDRYEASPMFRQMLHQLNLFWAVPALLVGAGVTAAVVTEKVPQDVSYAIGWGVPPVWVGIWVIITIPWVQMSLRREKEAWSKSETRV